MRQLSSSADDNTQTNTFNGGDDRATNVGVQLSDQDQRAANLGVNLAANLDLDIQEEVPLTEVPTEVPPEPEETFLVCVVTGSEAGGDLQINERELTEDQIQALRDAGATVTPGPCVT